VRPRRLVRLYRGPLNAGVRAQPLMATPQIKRPAGATVFALLLGWLSLAGFLNSFIWWTLPAELPAQALPRFQAMFEATRSISVSVLAFLYGVSALTTSIALWRMRPWMREAMTCWVLVILGIFGYLFVNWPIRPRGILESLMVLVVTLLLFGAMWLYVARQSKQAAL